MITETYALGLTPASDSQVNSISFAPEASAGMSPWGSTSRISSPFGPYSLQSSSPWNSRNWPVSISTGKVIVLPPIVIEGFRNFVGMTGSARIGLR